MLGFNWILILMGLGCARLLSALYVLTALRPVVSWTPYEPIRRMGRFSHGTLQTRVCTLKCQMATLHNRFVAER